MTHIVLFAARASSSPHLAIVVKEHRVLPDLPEALLVQIARLKLRSLEESAWVDFTFWTDSARSRRCATQIKTR